MCPVCGSLGCTKLLTYKKMELYRCPNCGAVYMDPMPTLERRHALYDDPYEGASTGYYAKAEKKMRRSRRRAVMLDRFVANKGHFLDVGCSGGFMVEAMRERGYVSHGIDPDAPGVAYAREHFPQNEFKVGFLEDLAGQDSIYDAIYCSEVIEHVPEPRRFVSMLAKLLKLGGVVNLTTPDVAHWNRSRDITRWKDFCPPSHCIYFTPRALRILLAAHGIEVIHHRFNWKAGIQFYGRKVYHA